MKAYELTLLSPLYYRSKIESGAAGATVTSPWIGDLAMMYGINNALGIKHINFGYKSHKPNYKEILDLGFLLTVLEPLSNCRFTKVFDIATNFMSEGYPQCEAISKSARAPMRNWMKRQGLEPGNKFSFISLFKGEFEEFPKRFTVRLGNTRESVALIEEMPLHEIKQVTVNLYTLSIALGNQRFSEILDDIKTGKYKTHVEQASAQYILAKGIDVQCALEIFDPYN